LSREDVVESESVVVEIGDDAVAVVTLNRPDHLNTFNTPLAEQLDAAFRELDGDGRVRVIILRGAGRVFCAGIDLDEFPDKTAQEYRDWTERMERPLATMMGISKPVIAQVHGVAVANGAGVVAAADLAIAGVSARLGLTAINVGLNCIGPVVPVSRSVGRKKALELLFFGDLVSAETAVDIGLINRAVPDEDLEKEARAWARQLAEKSPLALRSAKTSFYAAADLAFGEAISYMNGAFATLCTTEDAAEGIAAFKEKRPAVWRGL
jgi:enoyl-CoA hydratase/carnithine racemase